MAIGIYTSRVLLALLGVDDYGIYNLVAGIVAMFASLKVVFASSIQRFLNFAKGLNDVEQENKIFNLSLLIHFGLAIVFGILVEFVGIWLIHEKLNIPPESLNLALFVFQCAVISTIITIACIPFDAVVIANERFKYFAWLTLIDSVLKLLVVYLLALFPYPYLCTYAVLLIVISAINVFVNLFYCRRFRECKINLIWDYVLFKKLASFSAWNFFGNTAFSVVNEGLNVILNIFGGVAINAGRAIAYQIKSAVQTLCNNTFVAVQPAVVKAAAQKSKDEIFSNIIRISKLNFFASTITVIPIFVFSEYILKIWLGNIPPMSVPFVKLLMAYVAIRSLHSPMDLLFKAYGEIKIYQMVDSLTLVLSLPLSYFFLKAGAPLYCVFVIMCVVEIVNLSAIVVCAKKMLGFDAVLYFKKVGFPCGTGFAVLFSMAYIFNSCMTIGSILRFILYLALIIPILIIFSLVMLGKNERRLVLSFFKNKFRI